MMDLAPQTENIYTENTLPSMVTQVVGKDKNTLMRGSALDTPGSPTLDFQARPSPKKKKSWNEGLTKETDPRLREIGRNISKAKKGGRAWNRIRDGLDIVTVKKLYFQDGLTLKQVGKKLGVGANTVRRFMRDNNISRRRVNYDKIGKPGKNRKFNVSKEELWYLYIEKKMCALAISKKFNTYDGVVRYWLRKYDIPMRGISESLKGKPSLNKGKRFPQYSGENHPNWKGGLLDYRGGDWHYQRNKARERDKGICYMCGADERNYPSKFNIHHIVPYRVSHDNSLDNLMTLCDKCHTRMEYITEDS